MTRSAIGAHGGACGRTWRTGIVRQGTEAASRQRPDRELEGRGYRVPNGAMFSTINDLAKFVAWELGEGPDGS